MPIQRLPATRKVRVKTYKQFEKLLQKGHEEFYYEVKLTNGKTIGEDAPFDATDPMAYMMARLIYFDPALKCTFYAKVRR